MKSDLTIMFSDFGDFDLAEEPTTQDKEDRFRRAFENSKESYKEELIYTEPKVSSLSSITTEVS